MNFWTKFSPSSEITIFPLSPVKPDAGAFVSWGMSSLSSPPCARSLIQLKQFPGSGKNRNQVRDNDATTIITVGINYVAETLPEGTNTLQHDKHPRRPTGSGCGVLRAADGPFFVLFLRRTTLVMEALHLGQCIVCVSSL